FASCIGNRKDFHIDPYGKMSFCCYVVEPSMRYDLKNGTFEDCWENFIPSLWNKVQGGEEYRKNCGSCELRESCKWCPVYGYLEHGRYSAKVKYLCEVARENQKFKEEWMKNNRRYYRCADITIQVDSELPINKDTFHAKIKAFEVNGPGKENIFIKHHFYLPDIKEKDLEKEYYRKPPWAIYKKGGNWIYLGISNIEGDNSLRQVAVFNNDYTRGNIYNPNKEMFYCMKNSGSIAFFPSDQLLLARVMANRNGFYLHSAGVILDKKGLLFAGPSTAGKSTMVKMLKGRAEILCDDRIIIRRWSEGFKIYGTWSHGEVPDVSPNSAPLRVIFFLEKSKENKIIPLKDKKEITKRLLLNLIRPFVTVDWWEKTLTVLEKASLEVPCYILKFDKSGKIIKLLEEL
ncbi:MAG TPA: hypothetical protein PL110_14075, partial [Candidatus Eremiobacteraeota bacterium]|nr:hypothetical protein [Candidatus Eremiobacteraeota bacterium]